MVGFMFMGFLCCAFSIFSQPGWPILCVNMTATVLNVVPAIAIRVSFATEIVKSKVMLYLSVLQFSCVSLVVLLTILAANFESPVLCTTSQILVIFTPLAGGMALRLPCVLPVLWTLILNIAHCHTVLCAAILQGIVNAILISCICLAVTVILRLWFLQTLAEIKVGALSEAVEKRTKQEQELETQLEKTACEMQKLIGELSEQNKRSALQDKRTKEALISRQQAEREGMVSSYFSSNRTHTPMVQHLEQSIMRLSGGVYFPNISFFLHKHNMTDLFSFGIPFRTMLNSVFWLQKLNVPTPALLVGCLKCFLTRAGFLFWAQMVRTVHH